MPGTYTVRVEMEKFRRIERTRNVLSAAERLAIGNLTLQVGSLNEVVTVEAAGTYVNTAETQHSGLITSRQIEQIQVRSRDVTSLMRLVPGIRFEDNVEAMGESFGTLIPHVGGQRRDWNTVMIDGVLGNEIGQANRLAQTINLDSIAEVKVLLNNYRAEYGRTGGGQVQIITKSGGASYAGSLYYYGRHDKLNANNFFNNRQDRPKPVYRFNTYGGNLGGPLPGAKENLFFFYSVEAPLSKRPANLLSWTMPTERERRGDFSQTFNSAGAVIVIRDPQTGQPFPGNIIPEHRFNPNGRALLDLLPLPTIFDRATTGGNFNHQTQATIENPRRNQIARVDWKPSDSDRFYFTYKDWYSDQRGVGGAGGVTAGPAPWGWFQAHYKSTDRGGSANYTKVVNASIVNEAAFGIRQQTEAFTPLSDADWTRASRAAAGYTLGQFHPELNPRDVLPKGIFNVTNPPNYTFDNRLLERGEPWLFSFRNDLTWVKRNHALKSGVYLGAVAQLRRQGGRRRGTVGRSVHVLVKRHQQSLQHRPQLRERAHRLLPGVHGDRRLPGSAVPSHAPRMVRAGHVDRGQGGHAGPRHAFSLLPAVVLEAEDGGLRAGAVRSCASAPPVPARAHQQRQRRPRSGHRPDPPERVRRHIRSGHWRPVQRHGHERRPGLSARIP